MEDFIGTFFPELVSSEENMMLIKCPNYLEIKNVAFNLNGNSALVLMVLVVFSIILVGKLLDRCLQSCLTVF